MIQEIIAAYEKQEAKLKKVKKRIDTSDSLYALDCGDEGGLCPLAHAILQQQTFIARLLIEAGAALIENSESPSLFGQYGSALNMAAHLGNVELAELLSQRNDEGKSLLANDVDGIADYCESQSENHEELHQ